MNTPTKQYKKSDIKIERIEDAKPGQWKFTGKGNIRGTLIHYEVTDDSYSRLKKWVFEVRIPDTMTIGNYIEIRPVKQPQAKCWAGIERSTLTFAKATLEGYRGKVYSKTSLADPTGQNTTRRVSGCSPKKLPPWMKQFALRLKSNVKRTRGTDADACVAVFQADDYEEMIRFYFAVKVWVLKEGFVPED